MGEVIPFQEKKNTRRSIPIKKEEREIRGLQKRIRKKKRGYLTSTI